MSRAAWGCLRPKVIEELQRQPSTVHDIADELGVSYQGVADVVRMLRDLSLVTIDGRQPSTGGKRRVIYRLAA